MCQLPSTAHRAIKTPWGVVHNPSVTLLICLELTSSLDEPDSEPTGMPRLVDRTSSDRAKRSRLAHIGVPGTRVLLSSEGMLPRSPQFTGMNK